MLTTTMLLLLAGCAKDLRPKAARSWKDAAPPAAEARGRALLEEAAQAHGVDAWAQTERITLSGEDYWKSGLFRSMMTPLPDRRTGLTYAFVPGTGFTGEGEITTGKHTGERFGVDGTPGPDSYLVKDGRKRHKGGLAARIYAPSVQYFTEFPFRIREASRVGYVDDAQWNGRRYHRVLATWGDVRAHMKHDQYLVYVNAESKLIDLVRYTIRTAGPPMASAIAFTDVRDVGGMKLAFDVQVGFFSDDGLRTIHHLDVDEIVAAR